MKKLAITIMFLLAIGYLPAQENAEQKLSAAIYEEEVNGNLEEALKQYQVIVNDYSNEREVAAKAQLHIGMCYEKHGKQQATEAYNKVIENYADQQKTVEIAKERLQSLTAEKIKDAGKNPFIPSFKQIPFNSKLVQSYVDFSHDGKNFVFGSIFRSNNEKESRVRLFIADASGAPTQLLINSSKIVFESTPSFSPDGKQIAFLGGEAKPFKDYWLDAIYTVDINGENLKQISKDLRWPGRQRGPIWHPDGQHISLLSYENVLLTYNTVGKLTDSVPMPLDNKIRLLGYSPDGRWISYYNRFVPWRLENVKCGIVSTTGEKQTEIGSADVPAGYGTWSAQSNYFYYVAGKEWDQNIYRIKIAPESCEQLGEPEQITNYKDVNISNPKYFNEKSALFFVLEKEIKQIITFETDNPKNFKTIASGTRSILSPDGATVYFVGVEKGIQGIYSIPRTGGIKERLSSLIPVGHKPIYTLSPDGSTIAFFTQNNDGKQVLYFLSIKNSELFKSITIENNSGTVAAWSPDSKKIAYTINNEIFIVDSKGEKAELLNRIEKGKWDEPYTTRWSPDGNYIMGSVYFPGDVDNSIGTVSVKTGEFKRLTSKEETGYKQEMEWYPDSKKITYMYYDPNKDDDGIWEAYIDGRPATEMINQPDVWDYWGLWDPSLENYYFWGSTVGGLNSWHLYKFNLETKKISLIIKDNPGDSNFSFTKDGKYMVLDKREPETQLWLMEGVE